MKSYAFSEGSEVNSCTMNSSKRKEKISRNSTMSIKTKDFLQKICYKKTASIDMTQYGFINDSKLDPMDLVMKSLRAQLEKICSKPSGDAFLRHNSPVRKKRKRKVKVNHKTSSYAPQTPGKVASSTVRKPFCTTKSALSCPPGPNSPRTRVRNVRTLQSDPNPTTRKKKVRLMLPRPKGKKK